MNIDRTFRSDCNSQIFINIGYAVKLWDANEVRRSVITESQSCDVMSEHSLCALLHVEALHFPVSDPSRNATRFCLSTIIFAVQLGHCHLT